MQINPFNKPIISLPFNNKLISYNAIINHYHKYYPNKMIIYNINESIYALVRKKDANFYIGD